MQKSQKRKIRSRRNSFEVDQSVRIEELNRDTIVGIANRHERYTLLVPRKIKRHFNEQFRRQGMPRKMAPLLFAVAIVALLRERKIRPTSLKIDTEYASHEALIIAFIEHFYPKSIVTIGRIGKNSPAHAVAYKTYRKKYKPNTILVLRIATELLQKTTGELHHLEFTRIHKSNRSVKHKHSRRR